MEVDIAVVGGGIAGMSVAGELSRDGNLRIALLEQEDQLAYHSSGRSAAAFLESYGSAEIRALTRASRPIFDGSAEPPLLRPRPLLWLAGADHVGQLDRLVTVEPLLRPITEAEVRELCPAIRPGWTHAAAIEVGAQDLDVAALFDSYRRLALTHGAVVRTRATVHSGHRDRRTWTLETSAGEIRTAIVVNAAGAWADHIARRCGVAPVHLSPLRRTVAIATSPAIDQRWPLVCDVAETFYFRPEGDGLLVSPADETSTQPADVRPDVEDVALALHRVNEATTLSLRHVRTSWAGLRTFAPDKNPVVGYDPRHAGFFWLAGQGGYGMQTAPAMASLAAALIRGEPMPAVLVREGLDPTRLSPGRFVHGDGDA